MKLTISVIKADIGSVGGHTTPSAQLLFTIRKAVAAHRAGLLIDHYVSATGDDIAILMTHVHGASDPGVHKLAWDAFVEGTELARAEGLYGAGQDLLRDAFTGNVRGMGPAVAEMEIEERASEPF